MNSLALKTLYKVSRRVGIANIKKYNSIKMWINSGSVDIFGSDSETRPTSLSEMTLNPENSNVSGHDYFDAIPVYLAIRQNTGTTNEVIVTGLELENLGNIN